jgi:RimJ/RimL family protein N-acetyltransferase
MRFATRLGYEPTEQEIASSLDPKRADLSELEPLLERASAAGLRLVPLRDVLERQRDLFEFYGTSGSWPPAHEPETEITFDDFVGEVLESPLLEPDGSAVLVDADGRIASLAVLAVDRERRRAENDWTGTLPELRERGLARLVKLATIRWAREAGLREIVTSNMSVNIAMLAVNQRLGYRELFVRHDLERDP